MSPVDQTLATLTPMDTPVEGGTQTAEAQPASAVRSERQPRQPQAKREPGSGGGRDQGRRRDRQPRGEPRPVQATGDRPAEQQPRRDDRNTNAQPRAERHQKRDNRQARDDQAGSSSMGDHMPAFLLRPVPQHLIKRKKESELA
jgi:hypothetical protein